MSSKIDQLYQTVIFAARHIGGPDISQPHTGFKIQFMNGFILELCLNWLCADNIDHMLTRPIQTKTSLSDLVLIVIRDGEYEGML